MTAQLRASGWKRKVVVCYEVSLPLHAGVSLQGNTRYWVTLDNVDRRCHNRKTIGQTRAQRQAGDVAVS